MTEPARALLEFVNGELLAGSGLRVAPDTPLFDDGLIDSLSILTLIAFVEAAREAPIPDRDIVMSNFRTVNAIASRFLHAR